MDDPWLKVDEVAKRIGYHPDTVRRLLRERKLAGHLINRRGGWRVRASEVDRFIAGDGITIRDVRANDGRLVVSIDNTSLPMFQRLGHFIAINPDDPIRPVITDSRDEAIQTGVGYFQTREALSQITRRIWNDELSLDAGKREMWSVLFLAFSHG